MRNHLKVVSSAKDAVTNSTPSAVWPLTQLRADLVAEQLQERRVLVPAPDLRRVWPVIARPLLNIRRLDAVNAR